MVTQTKFLKRNPAAGLYEKYGFMWGLVLWPSKCWNSGFGFRFQSPEPSRVVETSLA